MSNHKLCDKHSEESLAWLDYRLPAKVAIATVGEPVSRFDDWRNTIRAQRALIRQSCINGEDCE